MEGSNGKQEGKKKENEGPCALHQLQGEGEGGPLFLNNIAPDLKSPQFLNIPVEIPFILSSNGAEM